MMDPWFLVSGYTKDGKNYNTPKVNGSTCCFLRLGVLCGYPTMRREVFFVDILQLIIRYTFNFPSLSYISNM